jgi:hypothetical protein
MGQKRATDRLSEDFRKQILDMLEDPTMTQEEIAGIINARVGEKVVSRSSINRLAVYVRRQKEKEKAAVVSVEKSLLRITEALECIAGCLKNH